MDFLINEGGNASVEDYKGRCGLYHAIKRKDPELIPLLLQNTELKNYKTMTFEGDDILKIALIYLSGNIYLRRRILKKYEELDEAKYVKQHMGGGGFKHMVKQRNSEMDAELLKLQRKLLMPPGVRVRTSLSPSPRTPTSARSPKPPEYNYDLRKFKTKLTRRASISEILIGANSEHILQKPILECQPLEFAVREPYSMYILYIYIYTIYIYIFIYI